MKSSNKIQQGLVILNRDNFHIYTQGIAGFLTLEFLPTVVKNLEVVNQEGLEALINRFVESSRIAPSELTIILSFDVLFEKEIGGGPEENEKRQNFLDSLPFESINKIVIPKDQKPYIVTVNRDFLDGIVRAFTNLGFAVPRAVPYEFLKRISVEKVDVHNALEIIKKAEGMKLYNMLDYQENKHNNNNDSSSPKTKDEEKTSLTRLYILLGILFIVVAILAFFVISK